MSVYDHPEWLALMAAIRDNLADDVPRLLAAEWIEEHGEHERAEFIRVQIELHNLRNHRKCRYSRLDNCFDRRGNNSDTFNTGCDICREVASFRAGLLIKEEQLFNTYKCQWFGESWAVLYLGSDIEDGGQYPNEAFISRGFVSEVRYTLLNWVGGRDCYTCNHTTAIIGDWLTDHPRLLGITCPVCSGTGRTPAHGPAIARAGALERVTLTDRKPLTPRRVNPEGWQWYRSYSGSDYNLPYVVFKDFCEELCSTIFDTESAANDALSEACIRWALAQPVEVTV